MQVGTWLTPSLVHVDPAMHALPHAPQFLLSVKVEQTPLHTVPPFRHVHVAAPGPPFEPAGHAKQRAELTCLGMGLYEPAAHKEQALVD